MQKMGPDMFCNDPCDAKPQMAVRTGTEKFNGAAEKIKGVAGKGKGKGTGKGGR